MAPPFDDEAQTKISPPNSKVIAGRYRLGRFLASGGFATVHEGSYSILDQERRVAIKLMKATAEVDPASKIRFREEVKTLCLLDDPNICKVIDGGIDGVTMFLVMDFAEGGSLKSKLDQSPTGKIAPRQAIAWMTEAARGLLAAEQNRAADGTPLPVIHRDVKPANLLLKQGRVVVADFGAAKLGGDHEGVTCDNVPAAWTPDYGSPEQRAGFVDQRSDIYSLGASFYQLLTGKVTRERFADPDQRFAVAHDPRSVCAEVPAELGDLIRRMTEPDPKQRPQSFAEVLEALEQMRRQPVSQWAVRALLAAVAAVTVVVLLQVLGVIPSLGQETDPSARTLQEEKEGCDEIGKQLAALRPKSWEHLDDVRTRFEAVEQKLATNRARLAEIEGAGLTLDQRPKLGEAYVQLGPLNQDVLTLQNVPKYHEVRDQLLELRGKLPQTSSQAAAAELARTNETLGSLLPPSRPLLALFRSVEEGVASCRRERTEQVAALRRRLDGGDLEQLPPAARAVAESMRACDEGSLTAAAEGIAASAERAAAIAEQRPTWPPAGREDDVLNSATFQEALEALAKLDAQSLDADLAPWWQNFTTRLRSSWSTKIAEAFQNRAQETQRLVAAFNDKAAKARTAGFADDPLRRELASVEQEVDRLNRMREDLERLCTLHQLPDELKRALLLGAGTPLQLPGPAMSFDTYEAQLRECVVPETVDPAIEAARADLAQRRATLQQVLAAARSAGAVPDTTNLSAAGRALQTAQILFDDAVATCRGLRDLATSLDKNNVVDMRNRCLTTAATKQYAALEALRASTLQDVERVATERTAAVRSLENELRGGTDAPSRVRDEARAVAKRMADCTEDQLAERARAIGESAGHAVEMLAKLASWRPEPELGRNQKDLLAAADFLKQLGEVRPLSGDAPLAEWWTARRKAIVATTCASITARWRSMQSALDQAVAAENANPQASPERDALAGELKTLYELRSRLLEHGNFLGADFTGNSQLKLVTELASLPSVAPGETFPAGWPTRQFRAPAGVKSLELRDNDECRKLYPADFLVMAASRGLRLWYFAERRDTEGPIYMAFCQNKTGTKACLVDVHPVTLREIAGYFGARADYEDSLDKLPPETLAFNSSLKFAEEFALMIPPPSGMRYTLPPEDWRDWPQCQPFQPIEPVVPTDEARPALGRFKDVAMGGFAYLRSGVMEWTRDREPRGVSEIKAPSGPRGSRRIEVGCRLALDLVPVAR